MIYLFWQTWRSCLENKKKTQSVAIPHRTMVKQVKPISLISDEISFTKKTPGNKTILRERPFIVKSFIKEPGALLSSQA